MDIPLLLNYCKSLTAQDQQVFKIYFTAVLSRMTSLSSSKECKTRFTFISCSLDSLVSTVDQDFENPRHLLFRRFSNRYFQRNKCHHYQQYHPRSSVLDK